MIERLIELKDTFEKENEKWRLGIVDYEEDIEAINKTIYLIIKGDKEDSNKNKYLEISFYYCSSRTKDDVFPFRDKVLEFKKLAIDILEDIDFPVSNISVNYGSSVDKGSIRIAEINMTFDITRTIDKVNYGIMKKMNLNMEVNDVRKS